jgi:hypothetical protein
MNRIVFNVLASAACAALLCGCQTPGAVRELAEKSSANAGAFQQQLAEMAAQSKALAARRAEHIAAMDAFNAELDAYLKRELYMREKSLPTADWARLSALLKELAALRDQLAAIEAAAQVAQNQRRQVVLGLHTDLNTFQAAMRDAANSFDSLAKARGGRQRAEFLGKFVGEVHKEVQKALESNDATAQAAKAALDKIKAEFKTDDTN